MLNLKRKGGLRLISVAAVLFFLAMCVGFTAVYLQTGSPVYAQELEQEDHSADIALTNAFITGLPLNDDGTAYILPSGNYYLASNVSISKTIELESGAAVSLCLNGKTITFTGDANYRYPVFRVVEASMTLTDCVGNGKIDGNNRSGSVIYVDKGSFTLASGGITGGRGTIRFDPYTNCAEYDGKEGYGYGEEGFYIQGGGVFALDSDLIITGGAIYGNGVAAADARWYGEDVTKYERHETSPGNGVYEGAIVEGGNHITYHSGDTVQISRAQGGGVFIGTTYENRDTDLKSTFVMSGGSISNNVSYLHGAGMFVHNVDFEMRGGVVGGEHKYIDSYSGSGATISFTSGGNVAQAGLQGLGSTVGGGMYIYRGNERGDGNDIKLSGTAEISYNVAGSSSAFTITEGSTVDISGSVSISHNVSNNGAIVSVGSSTFSMSGGTFEENVGTTQLSVSLGTSAASFSMTGGYIRNNTGGSLGSESAAGKSSGSLLSVSSSKDENKIDLSGVVITDNEAYGSTSVSITGGSVTIKDLTYTSNTGLQYYNASGKLTSGSSMFQISKCATLTVSDSVFSGNTAMGGSAGLQIASRKDTVYNIKNVTVSDNTATSTVGLYISHAVSTELSGTVNLEDVTVSGNATTGANSGIYVASSNFGATVKLTGVDVMQNTAKSSNAGLYIGYNITAEMTGGSVSSNVAGLKGVQGSESGVSGSYAGIYLGAASNSTAYDIIGAKFTASGVTVANNTAANSSAGIYVGGGAVRSTGEVMDGAYAELTDCSVINNTVTGYYSNVSAVSLSGGSYAGVYVGGGATLAGGKYYAHKGTLKMTNGSVSGNTGVTSSGIYSAGDVELNNVSVDNNSAGLMSGFNVTTNQGNSVSGAGIYLSVSNNVRTDDTPYSFVMNGGSVSGNTATGNGGGIYANGGNNSKLDITIGGVTVSGNKATGYYNNSNAMTGGTGGGIYFSYVNATLNNVNVEYNYSRSNGGGMYISTSDVNMTGCNVRNNVTGEEGVKQSVAGVSASGGGIYIYAGSYNASYDASVALTFTDGNISNNSATNMGGGVYIGGGNNASVTAKATFENANITDNVVTGYYSNTTNTAASGGAGGGLYLANSSSLPTVTLTGTTTVSGNRALTTGGGVYIGASNASNYSALISEGATITRNYSVGNGSGVYLAAQYSGLTISGSTKVYENVNLDADGKTEYVDNVFFGNSSTQITIAAGGLGPDASIGVYINSGTGGKTITTGATSDVSALFFSDREKYTISNVSAEDFNIVVKYDSSSEGNAAEIPGDVEETPVPPTPEENPAVTITITLSVTDTLGAESTGGVIQGVTSLYYDGVTEDTLNAVYTITIRDGYYLASVTFNGAKYYFRSYDGYLYVTTDNTAGSRCEVSPFKDVNGVLNFSVKLDPEVENTIILAVEEIEEPFTISDVRAEYDGNPKHVNVSKNSIASSAYVGEFASYVSAYTIEYMIGGIWTTEEPVDAGIYAVRVTWDKNLYVGSSNYGADIWTITINAQVWDSDTTNIFIRLSEYEYTYHEGEFKPEVTVLDTDRNDRQLVVGVEYEVTYSNNNGAGIGVVTITGIGNYTGTRTSTFIINKALNELTYSGQTTISGYSFNSTEQTVTLGNISAYLNDVTASVSGPQGAKVSFPTGSATFTFINAGTYVVTFSSYGDNNYESDTVEVTVEVAKAVPKMTLPQSQSVAYNVSGETTYELTGVTVDFGLPYTVEVSNGGVYNDNGMIVLGNAGLYKVTVQVIGNDNYEGVSGSLDITVTPFVVARPNQDTTTFVYDGTPKTYTLATSAYYTIEGETTRTNAGEETIYLTLKDTTNFCWNGGDNGALEYRFTILRADNKIDLSNVSNPRLTYNGQVQTVDISGVTAAEGTMDAMTVSVNNSGAAIKDGVVYLTNAGTYTVTFSVQQTTNYNAKSETLSIVVDRLTVARPGADGTSFVYNGKEQTYVIAASNDYEIIGATTKTDAGTTYINVQLNDTVNKRWDDNTISNLSYAFTIAKATNMIDLSAVTGTNLTFNGEEQKVNVGGVTADFGRENMVITPYGATVTDGLLSVRNAGTYTVTFTVEGSANYDRATATLTVNVAVLQIDKPEADTTTFVYDATPKTYNIAESEYYVIGGSTTRTVAGNSVITATLLDTANTRWSDGTTAPVNYTFKIAKATPVYSVPELVAVKGDKLSDIKLPEGWSWAVSDPTSEIINGTTNYTAVFTPTDSENYEKVTTSLRVVVDGAATIVRDASENIILALAVIDVVLFAVAGVLVATRRKKNGKDA